MRAPYWLFRLCDRIVGLVGCWIICVAETTETGQDRGWITRRVTRRRWMIERRPA